MNRQADMLDYVVDNEATGMREIYRDSVMVAHVGKRCVEGARHLKDYDATGPWGTYPEAPVAAVPVVHVPPPADFEYYEIEKDPVVQDVILLVRSTGRCSIAAVQRHLRLGYNRAAAYIEHLEKIGVVTAPDRYGARTVIK